jgi:hypothetical protein
MVPINMISHRPDKELPTWPLAKIFHGSMSKVNNTGPTMINLAIVLTVLLASTERRLVENTNNALLQRAFLHQ